MDQASTFSVKTTGEILEGFDIASVESAFAELFKVPLDKAQAVVGKQVTLKKEIDSQTAKIYQKKLESIGLGVALKELNPSPKLASSLSLALEPTEEELQANKQNEPIVPQNSGIMTCPKCHLEQPKAAQCDGCGVYIHKVMPVEETTQEESDPRLKREMLRAKESVDDVTGEQFNSTAIIAAAAAAIAGAFLWKFIAIQFQYELGIVAWAIGGAVGFSAAVCGSRGQTAGVICGALALAAIIGGKYLVVDSLQSEIAAAFGGEVPEEIFEITYQSQLAAAENYQTVNDDASLRQFIVDFGYSEAYEPEEVSQDDIEYFKDEIEPILIQTQEQKPSFEQWQDEYMEGLTSLSTTELLKESFGIIDIVFLFLGVATAFRLGSQSQVRA